MLFLMEERERDCGAVVQLCHAWSSRKDLCCIMSFLGFNDCYNICEFGSCCGSEWWRDLGNHEQNL